MENKNILEFCLSPDLGGLELFMVNCYKNFKEKTNCKVVVAPNKKLAAILNDNNPFYIKRNKLFPIFPAIKLAKIIDESNIDIIHFHWTKDIATVVLAKVLSKRKPKIMQTRNMTMTRFKNDFYHKWIYKHINTMHAVTYQVKEQIEKFVPIEICPKVEMVYMGTSEKSIKTDDILSLREKYNITDQDTFIVGIVGRIEEAKGQYIVIDAIKKLEHLNIKAIIVGHTMDEEYLSNLKHKTKLLGIENKVIFTGFTKEVDAHMQLFDVNILATPRETFGLVVIEAMINKVCMIATNNGGPLEIIENKIDGLLFDRTSTDLSLKIKSLYDNENYKNTLAEKGHKKAKELFENSKQLNKLYKVINES